MFWRWQLYQYLLKSFSQLSNLIRPIQYPLSFSPQVSSEKYQTLSVTAGLTPLTEVQTSLK